MHRPQTLRPGTRTTGCCARHAWPSVEPTPSAASADSAFARARPVTYIDSAKGYNQHLLNLLDMRNMSVPRATLLLFDEATGHPSFLVTGVVEPGSKPGTLCVRSGTVWEGLAGFCRAASPCPSASVAQYVYPLGFSTGLCP